MAAATTMPRLEPLTTTAVVFRTHSTAFDALPHVATLVSSYLDGATPDRWSIECACEQGLGLRMLKRLAVHEAAQESPAVVVDPFYRSYLASKGLVAAIRRADDVEVVEWICCEYCPSVVPVNAIVEATSQGRLNVLKWLLERYPSVSPSVFIADKAVAGGYLTALQLIFAHQEAPDEVIQILFHYAAICGQLDIMKWLDTQYHCLSDRTTFADTHAWKDTLSGAIESGHFEVAKYLVGRGVTCGRRGQVVFSARSGDLEMIKWLQACGTTEGTSNWINYAAPAGHLHIVRWAHESLPSQSCSVYTLDEAARQGHCDVVQWLHENRTEGCTSSAMDHAATSGHFDIVRWLHVNRTEGCTKWAMNLAAKNGHFEIVKWLHENRSEGCTTEAMNGAASSGHIEIVKWLDENRSEGCTASAMDGAAGGGHLDVVQWLHTHRPEGCTTKAMDDAAKNGHLEVVEWLHANRTEGCTTNAMDRANSLQVLRWLFENRSEGCTSLATKDAVRAGNFEKPLFLDDEHLAVCDAETGREAIRHVHFEIFRWLRARFPGAADFRDVMEEAYEDIEDMDAWGMFVQFEA